MNARSPLIGLAWDIGLPLAGFYGMRLVGVDEYLALLTGTVLAAVRTAWVAWRHRDFDAFAAFLALVLGSGLVLAFITGDPVFLLVKESFGTAAIALVLLGSAVIGRPLVLAAVRRAVSAGKREEIDERYRTTLAFRRAFTTITVVWGLGLLAEAVIRLPLVLALPIDVAAGASPLLFVAVLAVLSSWTAWFAGRVERTARRSGPGAATP